MPVTDRLRGTVRGVKQAVSRGRNRPDSAAEALAASQLGFLNDVYLPWSPSSITRQAAVRLCNELAVNQRRVVVEFGPGISTLVMAHWAEKAQVPLVIVGIEEDLGWLQYLQPHLNTLSFADVRLIHAPLTPNKHSYPVPVQRWYDLEPAGLSVDGIDLVLVDGPSAYMEQNRFDRYPALSFVQDKLSERCLVVLDDTGRKGEAAIARLWVRDLASEDWATSTSGGATWFVRGRSFTT